MKKLIENRATFLKRLENHFNLEDIALIEFAYDLSKEAHRTQSRKSGERYFEHPRAGCLIILDELGLYDRDLLIAFLLHDVGEDTPLLGNVTRLYDEFVATMQFRIGMIFGKTVSEVVVRLTKPSVDSVRFHSKEEVYAYYIANIKESLEIPELQDVVIGKMTDRLHNLRSLPLDRTKWINDQINETETIYLPIFSKVTGPRKKYADQLLSLITTQIELLKTSLIS